MATDPLRKRSVLVVDDNVVVRTMVRHLFESEADFEVTGEAENGLDAVQKAKELKPHLVILDLAMPVMNGFDAAPQLRKLVPDARIILFTVEEGEELERLACEAGVHAVTLKSQAQRLVPQARSLLAQSESKREPDQAA